MKTNIIRLPEEDTAMLVQVQKRNKLLKDIQVFFLEKIRREYAKLRTYGDLVPGCLVLRLGLGYQPLLQ